MDITITASAEKFIRRMVRMGGTADGGFRLSVTAGGCSGLAGEFSVEAAPLPGDAVFEQRGMRLFLPAESRLLLAGVTIDFADTPTQTGLVFHDPKTVGGSCGSSSKDKLPGVASFDVAKISIGRPQ
jgi:iron-sulfur cluster assembly accessory protein